MATTNYVKFQRGSPEAYNKLINNNRADSDTLYFVYRENEDSGKLYLGDKTITASSPTPSSSIMLEDLGNVVISQEQSTQNDSFLSYDISTSTWRPRDLEDVAADINVENKNFQAIVGDLSSYSRTNTLMKDILNMKNNINQIGDMNTLIKTKPNFTLVNQVNDLTTRLSWRKFNQE